MYLITTNVYFRLHVTIIAVCDKDCFFIPGTSTSGVSTVNSTHGGGGHMHTSSSSQNFRELKSEHVRFFTELQDVQKSFQVRLLFGMVWWVVSTC